jgi:ATP-dependent helicase Lhr and Lhr-like helicase
MGGRMSLSSNLSKRLREVLDSTSNPKTKQEPEIIALLPLLNLQKQLSAVPKANQLLVEYITTKDGHHLFIYTFEGRGVNEAVATLLAYRIAQTTAITFSIAMNDYGFELLSDQKIPIDKNNILELLSEKDLYEHIQLSVNSTEMAKRKFRDIAVIGGLIFQGYPGEQKKARHLQNSASLLYKVLKEYEPNNLLLRQAYTEVMEQQMEEGRLRDLLKRIQQAEIIFNYLNEYTPFCFPIKVDSIRENLSSEQLADRIKRMHKAF